MPGASALWVGAAEKLGSGKVTTSQVLTPAIELAQDGYPVHEVIAYAWSSRAEANRNASVYGYLMLLEGQAPKPGEVITMPDLAQTFRELAKNGKEAFYKGRIAEAIVELHQSKGGFMTLEDLANHAHLGSEEVEPISYTYRHGWTNDDGTEDGVTLHECPPNRD